MTETATPQLRGVSRETKLVIGLVSGAEFVNHMYLVLFPPILGLLAADFGVSLTLLGLAMGAQGVTNATLQLPFGYLSDNYDRQLALGLSLGLGTVGVFVVAVAPSYPVLVVGQLLLGAGVAGHHPTHFPLLSDAAPPDLRGRAFSMRGFAGSLGFAAPPALMTVAIGFRGLTWRHAVGILGGVGLIYTVVTLLSFRLYVGPEITSAPESTGGSTEPLRDRLVTELGSIAASPGVLALAALALVSSMAGWGVRTFLVVLLTDGYGIGLDLANLALTGMFVVAAVMVLVGGDLSDRFAPGPLIVASFGAVALLVAVVGATLLPPLMAIGVAILIGGVRSLGGPARSKLADAFSARGDLGRSFAVITVGTMAGGAIAPPVLGAVIDVAGLTVAFGVLAVITMVAALLAAGIVRRYGDGTTTGT